MATPSPDPAPDAPDAAPDPAANASDVPDPAADATPDPAADALPELAADAAPDAAPDASSDPAPDAVPDPERARRTAGRLLGGCAALTAMVGVFQLADILRSADQFGGSAWLGVVVAGLAVLTLIAMYGACTLNRATLHTQVIGRLDLFRVSTAVLLVAITAGILIPTRNTTALALLLPWGITYWVHGLGAVTPDATSSDEP